MERKESFELCPERYDRAQPEYPQWVSGVIQHYADIGPGKKLLEIGSGTGKATRLFSNSGASIECIDIGENLMGIAKKKFTACPEIKFIKTHFECYTAKPASYDLIYSANAFHWIRQPEGNLKVCELLKKEGKFALIRNNHVNQEDGFFLESQKIYEIIGLSRDKIGPKLTDKQKSIDPAFFKILHKECHPWEKSYTAAEYLDLIFTHPDHILMPDKFKNRFKLKMRELIDNHYDGSVIKNYLTNVEIAEIRDCPGR